MLRFFCFLSELSEKFHGIPVGNAGLFHAVLSLKLFQGGFGRFTEFTVSFEAGVEYNVERFLYPLYFISAVAQ